MQMVMTSDQNSNPNCYRLANVTKIIMRNEHHSLSEQKRVEILQSPRVDQKENDPDRWFFTWRQISEVESETIYQDE